MNFLGLQKQFRGPNFEKKFIGIEREVIDKVLFFPKSAHLF
jgi:hypothetical protein